MSHRPAVTEADLRVAMLGHGDQKTDRVLAWVRVQEAAGFRFADAQEALFAWCGLLVPGPFPSGPRSGRAYIKEKPMPDATVTITVQIADQPPKIFTASAQTNGNPAVAARGLLIATSDDARGYMHDAEVLVKPTRV